MNSFFWEPANIVEVNGIYNLIEESDQISVYVPKSSFRGGESIVDTGGIVQDDLDSTDAWQSSGLGYSMVGTESQERELGQYWDEVGSIQTLYASRPYSGGEEMYDNDAYDDHAGGQRIEQRAARIPYIKEYAESMGYNENHQFGVYGRDLVLNISLIPANGLA